MPFVRGNRTDKAKNIKEALNTYKKTNSSVMQFFDECIVERPNKNENGEYKIEDTCTKARIYNVYIKWCVENSEYKERKTDLFEYIKKQGGNVSTIKGYEYFKEYTLSLEVKKQFKVLDGAENILK